MEKQKNIPDLRFPEFDGGWERKRLGKIAEINPKIEKLPDSFIYIDLESVTNGELLKEEQIEIAKAPSRAQRLLMKGDVLFQMVRPYQKNNLFFDKVGVYVASTGYAQIRTVNNPNFIFQYIHLQNFVNDVIERCTGTSYPAINSSDLSNIQINIPSLPEQQKIASFLTAVDDKLTQLKQKKSLLEQYKKGVMQKIFSQEIRFKDENGKEFPKWEKKKLGEISIFLDGKRKPIKESDRAKIRGVFPYYGASGIIDHVNDYIFDDELILLGEDGENIISRNLPLAFKVSGKCWINNHAHVIKPSNKSNIDFITLSLERISYVKFNTGTAQPKLNQEVCKGIIIQFPCLAEQTQIANFLSALDEKINHCQLQIEKTMLYKKGLLQKMFC